MGWRDRATPVSPQTATSTGSWRDRAIPVTPPPEPVPEEPGSPMGAAKAAIGAAVWPAKHAHQIYEDANKLGEIGGGVVGVEAANLLGGKGIVASAQRGKDLLTDPKFKPKGWLEKTGYHVGRIGINPLNYIAAENVPGVKSFADEALKTITAPTKGTVNKLYLQSAAEIGLPDRAADLN